MPQFENVHHQPNHSKKDGITTLSLDDLENLDDIFSDELRDENRIAFDGQDQEVLPESKENIFLGQNPKARKVIEDTIDMDVDFEGVDDAVADAVKKRVHAKMKQNYLMHGLSGEARAKAESVINRLFTEAQLARLSEEHVEDAADALYKKIEDAVTEIEAKYASTH